ncbi:MAG: alpha/beta fold hydrolase [Kofleriaceae bacterium]
MRTSSLALVALVGSLACGGPATSGPRTSQTAHGSATLFPDTAGDPAGVVEAEVELVTDDGVRLAATYRAGPPGSRRAVVLLHQLSSTRAEWAPIVAGLAGRYHVLTLDMRGHGQSIHRSDGTELRWKDFVAEDWADGLLDLEAARSFLATMDIGTADTVYVGSSIAATQVLRLVGKYFDTAGIVLLSPGLRYRGLDVVPAAKQYDRPALLVTSSEAAPAEAADLLTAVWGQAAAGPAVRPRRHQAPGSAHGMRMAGDDPTLVPAIVGFIDEVLSAQPPTP